MIRIIIAIIATISLTNCSNSNSQTIAPNNNIKTKQQKLISDNPIEVAKEFVEAIANDDRAKVEELTGHSRSLLTFIYGDKQALQRAKKIISTIDKNSWRQQPINSIATEVRVDAYDSKLGKFPIVFEVSKADRPEGNRKLYISSFH